MVIFKDLGKVSDEFLPNRWNIFLHIFFNTACMVTRHKIGQRNECIIRVSNNTYSLVTFVNAADTWRFEGIMSLLDPDWSICDFFTWQVWTLETTTLHKVHVWASDYSSNVLQVFSHESISTSRECNESTMMSHCFNVVFCCLVEEFRIFRNIFEDPCHFLKLRFIWTSQALPQCYKINSFIVFTWSESLFIILYKAILFVVLLDSFFISHIVVIPLFKWEVVASWIRINLIHH